jgi:hypothetical protein
LGIRKEKKILYPYYLIIHAVKLDGVLQCDGGSSRWKKECGKEEM